MPKHIIDIGNQTIVGDFTIVGNLSTSGTVTGAALSGNITNDSVNNAISTNLSATRTALKIIMLTPATYASLSASWDSETIYIVTE